MREAEMKRQALTPDELEATRAALATIRVPSPRNPKPADEGQVAEYACMRCGHRWRGIYGGNVERTCPQCRSNSVRWLKS